MYQKHYATVIKVIEREYAPGKYAPSQIVVAPGRHGKDETLALEWRCGWGHCGSRGFNFSKGTVVKIYQRPQDNHPKFRRRGS